MGIQLDKAGFVLIKRMVDGNKWRRTIGPHMVADLDEFGPPDMDAGFRQEVLDKWSTIPELVPAPQPDPRTNDEIYDQVMRGQQVFRAYALAVNDGTIVPGAKMSGAALKAAVKAKM